MNAKRMIAAFAVLAMVFAAFAVVPADGPAADDEKYVELKGDFTSRLTFTEDQTVVVVGDLNIKDGGWLQISGDLTVKEGVTVTIEGDDGKSEPQSSRLYIIGNATIDGAVVSKTVNGLWAYPADGKEVVINGSVTAAGNATGSPIKSMQMGSKDGGTVTVNGTVTVGTNAQAEISGTSFSAGSELLVYGQQEGKINTAGHVLIDGTVVGESEILFTEASATIDIVSIGGSIGIRDLDMLAYSYGGEQYYVAPDNGSKAAIDDEFRTIRYNGISIKDVTNVRITEKVTTEVLYNEKQSKNMMTASVKTVISAIDPDKAVENTAGSSESRVFVYDGTGVCIDSMTLSGVAVGIAKQDSTRTCLGPAEVTVTGDVVFSYVPASSARFVVDGVLDVTGSLVLEVNDIEIQELMALVNAAFYKVKDADNRTYFHYTVLKQAIQSGATEIKLLGTINIDEDITVPAPVRLTIENPLDYIFTIEKDVTLTIADGAGLVKQIGVFQVSGTLVIENINHRITINEYDLYADIKFKSGQKVVYTNINKAMENAKAGDEMELFRPAAGLFAVMDDLTIPDGVILENNSYRIIVANGSTLTVKGKLVVDNHDMIMSAKDAESQYNAWNDATPASDGGEMKEYSVLRIAGNGSIVFKDGAAFAELYKFKIYGAYYNEDDNGTKGSTVITSPAVAFPIILGAYNNSVSVYGDVALDNLTVSGTEKERMTVVFTSGSKVTMKNFTFSYGTVTTEGDFVLPVELSGDIGTDTGRMFFDDASAFTLPPFPGNPFAVPLTFSDEFVNDSMNFMVNGCVLIEGKLSMNGTVFMKDFVPFYSGSDTDDMTISVPSGSNLFVTGNTQLNCMIDVEGNMTVTNSGTLSAVAIYVLGTVTVEKKDGHAGSVKTPVLMVGGNADSFRDGFAQIGASASVGGEGTFIMADTSVLMVFNGSTVSAKSLLDFMDGSKSTELYADGGLWLTAYAAENAEFPIAQRGDDTYDIEYTLIPALKNAEFISWQTYDEKAKEYSDVVPEYQYGAAICVGDAGYEKVYANIDRVLYEVTIVADMGIDDIFIDGKIILKDKTSNTFTEKVSAGTHTITYTLANGYSGNASITAIDGKTVSGSGLTFVIDDDKAGTDMKMEITVSGIEKSGYDTDPETHDEKASGLTTTEILLIVVVVIIAIMAVVLILRLNRS